MVKAVIFDVDGVVFDSEEIHYEVEIETLKKVGIHVDKEFIRQYSGIRLEEEFLDIAKKFNKQIDLQELVKIRNTKLEEKTAKGFPVVEHALEVIRSLSQKFLLAVATSGGREYTEGQLMLAGLLKYFKASIYAKDVMYPKPNPEPFLKAAKALGVSSAECVVIEDSTSGFLAAKAAGMLLIARKAFHNSHRDFSLADYKIEDLREIPKILQMLNS